MLKSIILKFLGLCVSPFPILGLIIQAFKRGWSKVFYVKTRTVAPPCLADGLYGKSNWVQLPTGIKMHYVEAGKEAGNKPLMVFLHGFPEFWFSWRFQLKHFSRDFWCVAPDLRGYNETSKPKGIHNYSVDDIVDDVKCLIEALGREKCVLVGHDWGGAIGYGFCGKYPEMASQYIVCNLPHPLSLDEQLKSSLDQVLKSWYILFFQCPILPELYIRAFDMGMFNAMFSDLKEPVADDIIEAYKYAFRDSATLTAAINYYRNALQYADPKVSAKRLNGLKVPVLSIFGTGDKYLSVAAAKGSRKFVKDFEEHYIEDCSHWVQMERPDEVNRAIEKYLSTRSF